MLVSLSDYAKIHGKSADTIRRMAESGVLKTAKKIGRNWVVNKHEVYPVSKRSIKNVGSFSLIENDTDENIKDNDFVNLQADFYQYMITFGGIAPKTSRDYISRLKFLAAKYQINESLTIDSINIIMAQEDKDRFEREQYSTKKAMSDFKSGLNKFHAFINSDYKAQFEAEINKEVIKVESSSELTVTQKETIIQARVGQGVFRNGLIEYWKQCTFSGCNIKNLLIASHIKPWRFSTNSERTDIFNGLLLLPNYDKLFDLGYITVDLKGKIIVSKFLPTDNTRFFDFDDIPPVHVDERHKKYLAYHNDNCFI